MKHLIENLEKFISESKAKKVMKTRTRKRPSDADKMLGKQIAATMKSRVAEIPKMLPLPWKITYAFAIDRQILEKFGEAMMENQLEAEYKFPIGISDQMAEPDYEAGQKGKPTSLTFNTATVEFYLSCYSSNDGATVTCMVRVDNFSPDYDEPGVMLAPAPPKGGLAIEAEWNRKDKEFDPSKNLFPLIKTVMRELKNQMPEYEEIEI